MTHPTPDIPATPASEMGGPFLATITPEAWIHDQAVPVDAPGPVTWDATAAVHQNWPYFANLLQRQARRAGDLPTDLPTDADGNITLSPRDWTDHPALQTHALLDNDDVLANDPHAPSWVASWSGPLTIHVLVDRRASHAPSTEEITS